jgi:hypothetical protein
VRVATIRPSPEPTSKKQHFHVNYDISNDQTNFYIVLSSGAGGLVIILFIRAIVAWRTSDPVSDIRYSGMPWSKPDMFGTYDD